MSILDWFPKKKAVSASGNNKLSIPNDLWVKCFCCNKIIYLKDLNDNFKVCLKCNYHFRLTPEERISYIFDKNSYNETNPNIESVNFLDFKDTRNYSERLASAQKKTSHKSAVITGTAKIDKQTVNTGIMNFAFLGGSMGSVVGEKITCLFEDAVKNKYPVVIFTSSGGARMQEGIISLMQMAKTSAAISKLSEARVPYITVLCDPTTGGTSASFAMLGDILIAEPGALISFAGPRVIEQTIRQKLPEGFQRAEFLLKHGMIDCVTHRKELKATLSKVITMLIPYNKKVNKLQKISGKNIKKDISK